MRRTISAFLSRLAPGLLAVGLIVCPAAQAQEPEGVEEKSEGRYLDGYLATGALCGAALWVVGKTARR